MKGTLDAYNFKLSAADPIEGSYVSLSSDGNPFFRVAYSGKNRNPNIIAQDEQDKKKYINLIDITKNSFIMQSQNWYNGGDVDDRSGTRIDMVKGKIESYNFNLISYNTNEPNVGSYLKLSSSGNPWIQIHYVDTTEDEEKNLDLLNISKKTFLMQSQDWVEEKNDVRGSGTQINLSKGTIKSYNFNLKAQNNSGSEYDGSYLQMRSNGNPYLLIHHKYTDSEDENKNLDKDILKISNNEYFLQSVNYIAASSNTSGAGTKFNLNTGELISYTGKLVYGDAILSSEPFTQTMNGWPASGTYQNGWRFTIGNKFGVTDTGVLYATGGVFSGTIHATGGTFSGNITASGTISGGTISGGTISGGSVSGASISGGSISIVNGNNETLFSASSGGVTVNGNITATTLTATSSGTIGPYTIGSSSLSGNNVTLGTSSIQVGALVIGQTSDYPAYMYLDTNATGGTNQITFGNNIYVVGNGTFAGHTVSASNFESSTATFSTSITTPKIIASSNQAALIIESPAGLSNGNGTDDYYLTRSTADGIYQPKGNYLTSLPSHYHKIYTQTYYFNPSAVSSENFSGAVALTVITNVNTTEPQ